MVCYPGHAARSLPDADQIIDLLHFPFFRAFRSEMLSRQNWKYSDKMPEICKRALTEMTRISHANFPGNERSPPIRYLRPCLLYSRAQATPMYEDFSHKMASVLQLGRILLAHN